MERWELKMICAAVALVVCIACSFLPYLLFYVSCKKLKNKFRKQKETLSRPVTIHGVTEVPSIVIDEKDARGNSPVPALEEETNAQPAEDEYSDLKIMGYLMCFGGGVFLGTFLLHMLPEVTELMQVSLLTPHQIDYNLTELIVGIGFFMILFVEEFVNACRKIRAKRSSDSAKKTSKSAKSSDELSSDNNGFDNSNEVIERQDGVDDVDDARHHKHGNTHVEHQNHDHDHDDHHHHHHHGTRSIALVLALSLHHIFEGLSIGLQKYFNNVWHLTVAVLCHETAICFSMGLQFFKEDRKLKKKVFVILLIAAVIMPLGIVIGIAISEIHQDEIAENLQDWQNILNGVLQALACGTFIYVTFFEILCEELTNGNSSPVKIIFVAMGFTLMALLGLIPEADNQSLPNSITSNPTTAAYQGTTI